MSAIGDGHILRPVRFPAINNRVHQVVKLRMKLVTLFLQDLKALRPDAIGYKAEDFTLSIRFRAARTPKSGT
jgi:hypothetical protein